MLKKYLFKIIFVCFLMLSTTLNAQVVLQDVNGEKIPFSSLKGKWVIINYWAPWCQPCREEIPEFNKFFEKNKNVAVFAVNLDSGPIDEQKQLIDDFQIKYPSLLRKSTKPLKFGAINTVPVTYIINPKGKLSETLRGQINISHLEKAIQSRY